MANPKDRAVQDLAPSLAQHEFGHYVAARILGFRVGEVSLTVTYPNYHLGGSVIELATSLNSIDEVADYLEKRIVVLYSGAMAESLIEGKVISQKTKVLLGEANGPQSDATSSQDFAKIRELRHILRSILHGAEKDEQKLLEQIITLDQKIKRRATELVETESNLIVVLGKNLAGRIKKSGQKSVMSEVEINDLEIVRKRFQTDPLISQTSAVHGDSGDNPST